MTDKLNEKNKNTSESTLLENIPKDSNNCTFYHNPESKEAAKYLRDNGINISQLLRKVLVREAAKQKKEGENG